MSHQPPTPVLPPILARLLDSLANQILSIDNQITTLRNGQITDGANTIRLTLADIQKRSEVIRGQLKTLVTGIADLRELSNEYPDNIQDVIAKRVAKYTDQHHHLHQSLRNALITSTSNLQAQTAQDRKELLATTTADRKALLRRRNIESNSQSVDERLLNSNQELTNALGQALKMMETEVERSAEMGKVLQESSTTMRATLTEYRGLSNVLMNSKNLVKKLAQRDWTDRLLIGFGFCFFMLAVVYVLKKRMVFPGLGTITEWIGSLIWALFGLLGKLVGLVLQSGDSNSYQVGKGEKLAIVDTASVISLTATVASAVTASVATAVAESLAASASIVEAIHQPVVDNEKLNDEL